MINLNAKLFIELSGHAEIFGHERRFARHGQKSYRKQHCRQTLFFSGLISSHIFLMPAIQGVEDKPGGSRRSRVRLHQLSCSVWEPLEINSALLPATLSPDLRAED